jgi:hypothetical protein
MMPAINNTHAISGVTTTEGTEPDNVSTTIQSAIPLQTFQTSRNRCYSEHRISEHRTQSNAIAAACASGYTITHSARQAASLKALGTAAATSQGLGSMADVALSGLAMCEADVASPDRNAFSLINPFLPHLLALLLRYTAERRRALDKPLEASVNQVVV